MLRIALVTLIAFLVYFQGSSEPFSNTYESQEALVVWEMSTSGNWILPRVNGTLIPSKPPFFHWLALAFGPLAGDASERAVRLPSVVSAALAVGMTFGVGTAAWGPTAGCIAAVALGTSPEWVKWATTARTDATFTLLLAVAMLLGERWLRRGTRADLACLGLATGLATLAKGFAAVALVSLVLVVEIARRRAWSRLRPGPLISAAAIFAAVAGSWYAAALAQAGFAFFHKQIVLENVLRFLPSEGGPSRHHALWFYFPMLAVGMLPWSIALPQALVRASHDREPSGVPSLASYCVTWILVVFVVCTLASGKRTNYLLPLYPAAALLVGRRLAEVLGDSPASDRLLRAVGLAAAGVMLVLALLLAAWHAGLEPWNLVLRWLHPQDRVLVPRMAARVGTPGFGAIVVAAALGLALLAASLRRAWQAAAGILGSGLVLLVLTLCRVLPDLQADIKSFAPFSAEVAQRIGDRPLRFFRAPDLAVLYYLRRHVLVEMGAFGSIPRPSYVLVWEKDWGGISPAERNGAVVVGESLPASIGRADTQLFLVRLDPIGS